MALTPRRERIATRVLVGVAVLSLVPLWDTIHWWILALPLAITVFFFLAQASEFCKSLAGVAGAILFPWLCLLGFNTIWHAVDIVWHRAFGGHIQPGLWVGLILACLVFTAASAGYLLKWGERRGRTIWLVALGLAAVNVVGLPVLLASPEKESEVAERQKVFSQLDLAIVVPGLSDEPVRRFTTSRPQLDWDVHHSVARLDGAGLDWLLLNGEGPSVGAHAAASGAGKPLAGTPEWRPRADQLILLNVDGTAPVTLNPGHLPAVKGTKGEIERWLPIARKAVAGAPHASIAVLLQTKEKDDPERFAAWNEALEDAPELSGSVASVQDLGARTLPDAGLVLAAEAPGAAASFALALKFRPVLLFDGGETLYTPLEIEAFIRNKGVDLCHEDESRCAMLARSSDMTNGPTHLRIHPPRRDADPASSIYARVKGKTTRDQRELVFIDYWWYLPGNPAEVGMGISCGIGLELPGKTCFDHDSDWEGLTVVLDRTDGEAKPVAVQYAQHADIVRYDFDQLRRFWTSRLQNKGKKGKPWRTKRFKKNLSQIDDLENRPLAFVARGTHATYPDICTKKHCEQVVKDLKENAHTGSRSWPANDTVHCLNKNCLRFFPTHEKGKKAALWNAYSGPWGDRKCILGGVYCDAEKAPSAPATQDRFKRPSRVNAYVDAKWKVHKCGGDHLECPQLPHPD